MLGIISLNYTYIHTFTTIAIFQPSFMLSGSLADLSGSLADLNGFLVLVSSERILGGFLMDPLQVFSKFLADP